MRHSPLATPAPTASTTGSRGLPLPASKILIFTHDPSSLESMKEIVEHAWEIPVVIATNPEQAIGCFHRMHPDLLVLDHDEAAHFLWEIRQDRGPDGFLPALVLLGDSDPARKQAAMMAGATDFLAKPVDLTEAMMRIHNLLSLREARQQIPTDGHAAPAPQPAVAASNGRLARLHGREEFTARLDRMHALGAMAGGIAHDFNNILMVVQGYTQQLLHESQSLSNAERQGLLCNIISAAQDGAEMVERLREFHLPDAADQPYQALDLNRLITQAVAFTRPKWYTECRSRGCAVSVREELSAIPPIHGHPVELRELLTNLIFNAVDAMPNGGLLTLRTRREGQEVLLDVTDTGSGMTERVRHHCLDPFFTTKGTQSMGMGLSLVHEFAERHHASLNVESKPGQGTTFHLRFAADVLAPDESPDAASDPSVRLKILVVDDDKSVGELICQMLVSEGHEVSQRCDPHEALRDATARFFDVVVTDQSMPLMNGEDLAAALKTAQPNTRIILITGFGSDGLGRPSIDCVLSKPFSAETLLRAVAATLASPPTPASSPRETAVLTH